MRKDDILEQLKPEGAWTLVRNVVTGREGMVPTSFLAKAYSLEAEPWFFGPITRAKVRCDDAENSAATRHMPRPRPFPPLNRALPFGPFCHRLTAGRKAARQPHAQARLLPHSRERESARHVLALHEGRRICAPLSRHRRQRRKAAAAGRKSSMARTRLAGRPASQPAPPSYTRDPLPAQSPSPPHDDLRTLVKYHKRKRAGLTTTLKDPCPREQPAK